jgi:hypothetical protein
VKTIKKATKMSNNNLMPPIGYNEATLSSEKSISILFSKLFESRDFAHYAHLQSKSYSQHKALGGFYESIVGFADTMFETYSGKYGLVSFKMNSVPTNQDVISYFESFAKFTEGSHDLIDKKDTYLHNQLDEISAEVYHLIYKLKNLK